MNVSLKKGITEKSYRHKHLHLDENYKVIKQSYFKSVRRYDITHSCIKNEDICCYFLREDFTKEKNIMNQCCIISVCRRAINIISCAQEGTSLITELGAVTEKKSYLLNIKAT